MGHRTSMGLDVYVGTLTRYLVGDWELIAETTARELGIPFEIARAEPLPADAITDPDTVRNAVLEWRGALAEALGAPCDWAEADAMPYFTDKPGWDGYASLLLLAAHVERPEIPLPEALPEDPFKHQLLESVLRGTKTGLLGRRKAPEAPPRFVALYTAELWLPIDVDGVWTASFVTGDELPMAAVGMLRFQLRELAETLGLEEDDLAAARSSGGVITENGGGGGDDAILVEAVPAPPAELGKFGLAVFLDLAEKAHEHRLPLKLDY
jgi:hypothetical protein